MRGTSLLCVNCQRIFLIGFVCSNNNCIYSAGVCNNCGNLLGLNRNNVCANNCVPIRYQKDDNEALYNKAYDVYNKIYSWFESWL